MRFVVRHIGKTGTVAHRASQHGFVFLSRHPANMRPDSVIFQREACHHQADQPMPSDQTERMDAALQRSLPEVRKLYRYERRAIAERDRALRKLSELVSWEGGLRRKAILQNEATVRIQLD